MKRYFCYKCDQPATFLQNGQYKTIFVRVEKNDEALCLICWNKDQSICMTFEKKESLGMDSSYG